MTNLYLLPRDVPTSLYPVYFLYLEGSRFLTFLAHPQLTFESFSLTAVLYVLKHIDLRKTPSLEFGMMIIFAYLPYGLAEGISLSGKSWRALTCWSRWCLVLPSERRFVTWVTFNHKRWS